MSNQIICKPLTCLTNISLSNGIFLDLLKNSNVVPVFKTRENQDYNNYQISLICSPGKLVGKLYIQYFTASSRKTLSSLNDIMVFVTNYPLIMLLMI